MAVRRWHVAVVNGALVIATAYLAGRTVSVAASAMWPSTLRSRDAARGGAADASTAGRADRAAYDIVAARDLFRTASPPADPGGKFRLVGVAAHLPSRFAVIEDVPRGTQRLYRLGDRLDVADGTPLTLARIEADRVVLEAGGEAHVLARGEVAPERRGASDVAARESPPGGRALVRRGRGDEYVVDRRAVNATFTDFTEMSKGIRVVPNVVAGESVGYRVFGIDAASLFARLGLRNGDVVQRVNAVALTDPGTALGILRDLPRERRIVLDISRRQRPQTLTYEIR